MPTQAERRRDKKIREEIAEDELFLQKNGWVVVNSSWIQKKGGNFVIKTEPAPGK